MILDVENLSVRYDADDGGTVHAVDGVSFSIKRNEIVGLLGESGGGKSTLSKAIVRDLAQNANIPSGQINYERSDLLDLSEEEMRKMRWDEIAYVPQNAMNCLDPVYTIRDQLTETIVAHREMPPQDRDEKAEEVLRMVGIDTARLDDYPHQMSGGMKQRIVLALSMILDPSLIIADEPTTGLDVLLRDKILADIERYREEFGISILIVSHDITDLVETCDTLMVMYGGKVVERAPSDALIDNPTHPYTMGLRNSLPTIETDPEELVAMNMEPPDLRNPPEGCIFVERCPFAEAECREGHPEFKPEQESECACYRSNEHDALERHITKHGWHGAEAATVEQVTDVE